MCPLPFGSLLWCDPLTDITCSRLRWEVGGDDEKNGDDMSSLTSSSNSTKAV